VNRRTFFSAVAGIAGLVTGVGAAARRRIGIDWGGSSKSRTMVAVMDAETRDIVRIDGVEVGEGSAWLLKDQEESSRNGVYVVTASR
jgi:hypothetical protein